MFNVHTISQYKSYIKNFKKKNLNTWSDSKAVQDVEFKTAERERRVAAKLSHAKSF